MVQVHANFQVSPNALRSSLRDVGPDRELTSGRDANIGAVFRAVNHSSNELYVTHLAETLPFESMLLIGQ